LPRSTARTNGGSPEYAEVGTRLRTARGLRGLSLRVLADRTGVSPSLISQVETGRAKPSVSTLYAIASELDISLDELLFGDPSPAGGERAFVEVARPAADALSNSGTYSATRLPDGTVVPPVQPAGTRKRIRLASGVVWERLTAVSLPDADFLFVTYEVGGASTHEHEFQRHPGREWGYILSGTLVLTVAFDEYVLGPGDAIYFDSTTPHRMHNAGHEPVHAIWFTLGRGAVDFAPGPPEVLRGSRAAENDAMDATKGGASTQVSPGTAAP